MTPSSGWQFRTERLIIEDWRTRFDNRALTDIVTDILTPAVTEFLPDDWRGSYTAERARRWIERRECNSIPLIVLEQRTQLPLGFLIVAEGVGEDSATGTVARIGFMIAESAWGRGFATELLAGFVQLCREKGLSSVGGGVESGNSASRQVMTKCGFDEVTSDTGGDQRLYRLALS